MPGLGVILILNAVGLGPHSELRLVFEAAPSVASMDDATSI